MIDSNGILESCYQGSCVNYNPDKDKPTGVKAHNIEGLVIYECLNFKENSEQKKENYCGGQYCSNRQIKEKN